MNIIYRGNSSRNGTETKILRKLKEKGVFENCITLYQTGDSNDLLNDIEGVTVYSAGWFYNIEILRRKVNFNRLLPLDKQTLNDMLPYESMALRMAMRESGFFIYEYSECKKMYLDFLRFWNHLLEKQKIDALFFAVAPHTMWEFVLCRIAQIKRKKMIILDSTSFSGRFVKGRSLDSIGDSIRDRYQELKKENIKELDLADDLKEYYWKQINAKDNGLVITTNSLAEKKKRKEAKKVFYRYILPYNVYHKYKEYACLILRWVKSKKIKKVKETLKETTKYSAILIKILLKRIFELGSQNYYNSLSKTIDLSNKFIYFALQMSPEGTTMPKAGVFVEQELSLKLLSKCIEGTGLKIYVKEHYIQAFREKEFYDDIKKIPNVVLIKTTENTYELIDNCVAVATQTGTCIWEGIIRKKPALVFGEMCCWKGMPGLYKIEDVEQGKDIISQIINNEDLIDLEDVQLYMKAVELETVEYYLDNVSELSSYMGEEEAEKKMIENTVQLIEGMLLDKCYE